MGSCSSKEPARDGREKSYHSKHALFDISSVESQNHLGSTVLQYAIPSNCLCYAEDEDVELIDEIASGARGLHVHRASLPDGKIVAAKVLVPAEVTGE